MHRLHSLGNHFEPAFTAAANAPPAAPPTTTGKKDSLSVVDNRTGTYFIIV